jgi:site-specific DNA recombinase
MQRAALYARVSTELQEKEQTVQSQLAAITRYADEQGLRHSPALTYTDEGYSGSWLDRPALDELRDHAREGRFDVVVVLCPDRLARRYAYQVLLLEELKRAGIEVQFCERPIGDSPDDQLLLQIQGAIAEYERAKILERCRRGRLHRARRGELAPPRVPYGYIYAARKYGGDGQIRLHPEESAMVRQAFAWYAEEGATLHLVIQRLNASPWKTRKGTRWSNSQVLGILRREWYVGRAYYNRTRGRIPDQPPDADALGIRRGKPVRTENPRSEWITVPVPRLIDDDLFARVQQRIEENRRFARRRLKRSAYLLKGLFKCGRCGYSFTGFTSVAFPKSGGRTEHSYYKCNLRSSQAVNHMHPRCTNDLLRCDGVDEVVWTTVRDLLLDGKALTQELNSWLARTTTKATADDRLQLTTARFKELQRQRERLLDAYQNGAIELQDLQPRKAAIEDRLTAVEEEQAELRSWASRRDLARHQVAGARAVVERLCDRLQDATFEVRQAILRLVVEKVVATGHWLEIHLALPVSGNFHLTPGWGAILTPGGVSTLIRLIQQPGLNYSGPPILDAWKRGMLGVKSGRFCQLKNRWTSTPTFGHRDGVP